MKNLDEFRSTCRAITVAEHARMTGIDDEGDRGEHVLLYMDSFYIEHFRLKGHYYLILEHDEIWSTSLDILEKLLWEWACVEFEELME